MFGPLRYVNEGVIRRAALSEYHKLRSLIAQQLICLRCERIALLAPALNLTERSSNEVTRFEHRTSIRYLFARFYLVFFND